MYNESYLTYLLDYNNLIYIDTSTLMNVDSLRRFLERSEDEFLVRNKKMIITQWVFKELNKHIHSDNDYKANQAKLALNLIEQFRDVFTLEDEELLVDNATFADSDILSKIILNKSRATQLLITYDRALALDAYNLNLQGSNKGGKVMVCHINKMGFIKKCDCVNTQDDFKLSGMVDQTLDTKERVVYIDRPVVNETYDRRKWWHIPAAVAGGLAGGIAIDRYAVPVIKRTLKSIA